MKAVETRRRNLEAAARKIKVEPAGSEPAMQLITIPLGKVITTSLGNNIFVPRR